MPTSRNDVNVQCPFYQYDQCDPRKNIRRIICEGAGDAASLTLNYRRARDYRLQLETFCCKYYDKCEVYRMLMEKYEDL